ncbi:DUF6385 domain-containing protein [Thermincola potens]|uniref:DUF6385 domain-containing protein n=1 Tax=Thermincola potens (strain JR) TaxID=635013 RepID=D5XDH0_THEPJ|nr:DUF6385 domain-containing protein [Thermincola potens]ADG81818.1 conserved hypothetical protein [Thermincola potens JR]
MDVTFVNVKLTAFTTNNYKKLRNFKVAFAHTYSFFVFNHSYNNRAVVRLLVSPDGTVFLPDGLEIDVPPRSLITLVPNYFSKYATVGYKSKSADHPAKLTVWFQMTRPPAWKCRSVGNLPYYGA